jgi:hypothetical protein
MLLKRNTALDIMPFAKSFMYTTQIFFFTLRLTATGTLGARFRFKARETGRRSSNNVLFDGAVLKIQSQSSRHAFHSRVAPGYFFWHRQENSHP